MSDPEILTGVVTGIMQYGAFIKLEDGRSGMVHISEISHDYVREVSDFLKIDDSVNVVLLEDRAGKLSFSIKRAQNAQATAERTPNQQCKGVRPDFERQKRGPGQPFNSGNRNSSPRRATNSGLPQNFEDMMSKFKQTSDEKLSSLKKATNNRRGASRKSGGRS
ncbi:MAG: S1 RNA-binding domain-containing protein [Oscillospiraceae bacterium]|nr:S1 RNA-binding domain-containing protein [Oscillospiraceae bacterium]